MSLEDDMDNGEKQAENVCFSQKEMKHIQHGLLFDYSLNPSTFYPSEEYEGC